MWETTGAHRLRWSVSLRDLYAYNTTFEMYLDGALQASFNESVFEDLTGTNLELEANITLDIGMHQLDLVVSGQVLDENLTPSEEPVVINNLTYFIARVDNSTPSNELRTVLGGNGSYLLLEPGTELEVEGLEPAQVVAEPWVGHEIHVVGAEGATITLTDAEYKDRANLTIRYVDPPEIHLTGGRFESISIGYEGPYVKYPDAEYYEIINTIRIDNTTGEFIYIDAHRCHLDIMDVKTSDELYIIGSVNASIHLAGCDLHFPYGYAGGQITSFLLEDSALTGEDDSGLTISSDYMGRVEVRNCTFDGMWLYVSRRFSEALPWELQVSNCQFVGDGAYLVVLWDMQHKSGWNYSPTSYPIPLGEIDNNVFSGEGAGLLLHHRLYVDLAGENRLEDGSAMWAWYMTEVTAACSDPAVEGYSEAILREAPTHFPMTFDIYNWPTKNEVILELQNGPASAFEPPRQVALLTWIERQYYGTAVVMGSGLADLTQDHILLYHKYWPDIRWTLVDAVEPWPIPMDFEMGD